MRDDNMKKILVPLDGSKNSFRALYAAINLARQCNTKLTGMLVLNKIPPKKYRKLKYPEKPELIAADKILEKAKKLSAKSGVLFEKKISFGEPGIDIVNFAESLNYDIIIIGSRGRSKLKEIFLGSVSNHVVHKSKIPVLVIK